MNNPLVSVIIPTCNRADTVSWAVQSVLEQTYDNLTLHLVDDGSTDETREIIEPFIEDSRFYYYHQENRGQSVARNIGISESRGDFIAFLDSDNYWLPDKLHVQLAFLDQNSGFDIVYSDGYSIDGNGNKLPSRSARRFTGKILPQLLKGNFISNNSALVKRRCFIEMGGFDETLRICEDYDLWLRFATRYQFLHHPQTVYCYCVEGPRLSDAEDKELAAKYIIYTKFFSTYPDVCSLHDQKMTWANFYRESAAVSKRYGIGMPWKDLMRATGIKPFDPLNWRLLAKMMLKR